MLMLAQNHTALGTERPNRDYLTRTFKKVIDMLMWRQLPPAPNSCNRSVQTHESALWPVAQPFVYQLVQRDGAEPFPTSRLEGLELRSVATAGWDVRRSRCNGVCSLPWSGLSQLFVIDFGIGHRK